MADAPSYLLVLTAPPGAEDLMPSAVNALRAAVPSLGLLNAPQRLGAGAHVFDLGSPIKPVAGLTALRQELLAALDGIPVDANVLPATVARLPKCVLACDMESTVIEQELINEIADLIGKRDAVEAITTASMRGEIDFAASLRRRVAHLQGLTISAATDMSARITLMPGADTLCAGARDLGLKTALITSGFSIFAEHVAARLGFDTVFANALAVENEQLTGRLEGALLGPSEKRAHLEAICARSGVALNQAIAVGDGANDREMLTAAGIGVAYRAKPRVIEDVLAAEGGVIVRHSDLSSVLILLKLSNTA